MAAPTINSVTYVPPEGVPRGGTLRMVVAYEGGARPPVSVSIVLTNVATDESSQPTVSDLPMPPDPTSFAVTPTPIDVEITQVGDGEFDITGI